MNAAFCMVLTTTNNPQTTKRLIDAILTQKLAACVQCSSIDSHYLWQGKVCNDKETLLVIKTTDANYAELERLIINLHDYETPQVIKVPFSEGAFAYLQWINQTTQADSES